MPYADHIKIKKETEDRHPDQHIQKCRQLREIPVHQEREVIVVRLCDDHEAKCAGDDGKAQDDIRIPPVKEFNFHNSRMFRRFRGVREHNHARSG